MARRPTLSQRRLYAELIARLEPTLRAAFAAALDDLRTGVDFAALLTALEARDIEAAIRALRLEPAAFYSLGAAKTAAYAEGGALTAAAIELGGGQSIRFRFDMQNPRAEEWIRLYSAARVTALADEARQAVRDTIFSGYGLGRHPNDIARDLVGRVSGGIRQGGILGLDGPRAARLAAVLRGMETAEGVRDLVDVVGGKPRVRYAVNPATAARILKAWYAGTAVPPAERELSARQYSNALLKSRGETIARTETAQAVRMSQAEAWRQVMDAEGLPPEAIQKTWIHGGGVSDPRPHHVAANGKTVIGFDTPFELANGARLQYPHDPAAPGSETINCTCNAEIRLRPGWGLEAEKGPLTPEDLARMDSEAREYVLSNGRANGVEFLEAVDVATGDRFRLSGDVSSVTLTDELRAIFSDPARKITIHHNHPSSNSLSPADLLTTVYYAGIKKTWAHGHNGSAYGVSAGRVPLKEADIKRVRAAVNRGFNRHFSEIGSVDEVNALFWHTVNLRLHRLGYIRYEHALEGESAALAAKHAAIIQKIVRGTK